MALMRTVSNEGDALAPTAAAVCEVELEVFAEADVVPEVRVTAAACVAPGKKEPRTALTKPKTPMHARAVTTMRSSVAKVSLTSSLSTAPIILGIV